ncbi:MAG: hypothetical protein OXI34_02295 [Chloroflexota bacterium]|nr:hypothetical protein [Chloroflexota bacterium]MDE2948367.1 hypothetical protein [Chloroflexota bacterium]
MLQMTRAPGSGPETDHRQRMTNKLNEAGPYILLLLLSLLVYLPVMSRAVAAKPDFGRQIEIAFALPDSTDYIVHVLYHAIFLSLHQLAPSVPHSTVALWAILLVMLPVPLIAFALLKRAAGHSLPASSLVALSFAFTIAAPITIWTNAFMLGYINPISYHNPTSIAARLFVIPLSLLALRIFQSRQYHSLNQRTHIILSSAAVVLLSALAKPSFIFVLLPGCFALMLWRSFRRMHVDWLLFVAGFCIPGIFMLGLFYLLGFNNQYGGTNIAFGFLTFMRFWIPNWRIPIQLLLSLAFPLVVFWLYFEQARRHLYLTMSWVICAVALAVAYLLYEEGPRFAHGNMIWSSYSAVFLLMFASLLFLVQQHAREREHGYADFTIFGLGVSRNVAFALLVFGFHALSGIAYCFRFATQFLTQAAV